MNVDHQKLGALRELTVWHLSDMADCGSPDANDSPGARFLLGVRDDFLERIEGDDLADLFALDHLAREVADGAVDYRTHQRWLQFVDLTAYEEDLSEYNIAEDDMTERAGIALYMIAERLVHALFAEAETEMAKWELDDDDSE